MQKYLSKWLIIIVATMICWGFTGLEVQAQNKKKGKNNVSTVKYRNVCLQRHFHRIFDFYKPLALVPHTVEPPGSVGGDETVTDGASDGNVLWGRCWHWDGR